MQIRDYIANLVPAITIIALILSVCAKAQDTSAAPVRFGINSKLVERYPNFKGLVGAYRVAESAFNAAGLEVVAIKRPAQRLNLSLVRDEIDLHITSLEVIEPFQDKIIASRLPITSLPIVMYHRQTENWTPQWPPDEVFKNKIGKSVQAPTMIKQRYGLNVSRSPNFKVAANMVRLSRADYFIDSLAAFSDLILDPESMLDDGYTITQLYNNLFFVAFADTPRGNLLNKKFDQNYIKILQQQRYQTLYQQHLERDADARTTLETIKTIRRRYPDLGIPAVK